MSVLLVTPASCGILGEEVCLSAWTAIIGYHRLCDLKNRNLFPHRFGSSKYQIRVPPGWFLMRPLLFADGCFLLCPHMPLEGARESSGVSYSSCKDTNVIGLKPHPYDLCFPGGAEVKNPPSNAGAARDMHLILRLGRSFWSREW